MNSDGPSSRSVLPVDPTSQVDPFYSCTADPPYPARLTHSMYYISRRADPILLCAANLYSAQLTQFTVFSTADPIYSAELNFPLHFHRSLWSIFSGAIKPWVNEIVISGLLAGTKGRERKAPSLLSPPGPGSARLGNAMETELPNSPSPSPTQTILIAPDVTVV